ncbi:MAG: glycolate oxidase subunit GlcD, partial [Deltaproteobacteria bacterium]|nr:glycolate oxidase subunit GlcD [Deltaproteobacteria bacterium]
IPALMSGIREISEKKGALIACFGHAGDGNIHVNVMYDRKNPEEACAAEEAVLDVFRLTLKLGGTISGEHGIGTAKAKYLAMELSPAVIDLMKRVKGAFDPNHILNPGKIFPADKVLAGA